MISKLRVAELAVLVLYSLAIIASAIPTFANISNVPVVIYYLFIPGYIVTELIKEEYNVIFRLGYSILIGIALVLCIFSLRQIFPGVALPFNVIIPFITILLSIFWYFRPYQTVTLL